MTEEKNAFDQLAEKKLSDMALENKVLLDQYHAHGWAIKEMSRDPAMTHKAWIKVWDAVIESDKRKEDQKKIVLKPIEEAMVKNIRNQRAIGVQMTVKNEQLLKATVKAMDETRKAMQERAIKMQEEQAAIERPYEVEVQSAVSQDEDVK